MNNKILLELEIPLIEKMEQIRTVDKEHKGRGLGGNLRHIINFKSLTLVCRGLNTSRCIGKNIIQLARRYSHCVLLVNVL